MAQNFFVKKNFQKKYSKSSRQNFHLINMFFQEYISNNNEIHDSILDFIDHTSENDEELFQSLLLILDEKKVRTNRDDLRNLLIFYVIFPKIITVDIFSLKEL